MITKSLLCNRHTTQECFQELHKACGDAAFPYRSVARCVKAFRQGRDAVKDNLRKGHNHVGSNTVQLLAHMLDAEHQWTARELEAEIGVCHKTVIHILRDILGYRKLAVRCIPHEISEMQ